MEQIYRLRFQVYGHEFGFIDVNDYPDGLEKDEYDQQSSHIAAINKEGEVVGSIRVILPGKQCSPMIKQCQHLSINPKVIKNGNSVELSRLVISRKLRHKKVGQLDDSPQGQVHARKNPMTIGFLRYAEPIAYGLCREILRESQSLGITYWFALMEKCLWQLFRMYGFKFDCIGEEVDVFGPVFPYMAEVTQIEKALLNYQRRYCSVFGEIPAFSSFPKESLYHPSEKLPAFS